jgi:hypothetical protein
LKKSKKTEWIQRQPCHVCNSGEWVESLGEWRSHAAHARRSWNSGTGCKPDDRYLVPLCGDCHREQHQHGEQFDMIEVAELYEKRYNSECKNNAK